MLYCRYHEFTCEVCVIPTKRRIFTSITKETPLRHRVSNEVMSVDRWQACAAPMGPIGARAMVVALVSAGVLTAEVAR